MSDLKKIALLFLVCLILALYSKFAEITPVEIGTKTTPPSEVLGTQTSK